MKQLITDLFDMWWILGIHIPLFVCSWIGCWIATMGAKRPSKFGRTLARGVVGGAVGGLLNPLGFLMLANGLIVGPTRNRVQCLEALPILLAEGAVFCLPLAILIARRKRREPAIKLQPPMP